MPCPRLAVRARQAALEAADVALMTDDLSKIVMARAIAAKAYRTIKENLIVGVGVVHVLGIIAALMRWIGPVQAAIIHLGPDLLVFVNSVKLVRARIRLPDVGGEGHRLARVSKRPRRRSRRASEAD